MKLFSSDSPIGRAIGLAADLVVLNLLFVMSCMPVLTFGAAWSAMYDTVHALLRGECAHVARHYFGAFRRCFLRGTALFLIWLAAFGVAGMDLMLAVNVEGVMGLLCIGVIAGSMILGAGVMAHMPMVLCRWPEKKIPEHLRMCLLLALGNNWRTVAAVVLNLLPWGLFLFAPLRFAQSWMFWVLLGFGAVAYMNNWLLLKSVEPELWQKLRPAGKSRC